MVFWRISNHPVLTGMGAEFISGRWHTEGPGKRVVYLAEHPAVALVENLANLRGDQTLFPQSFQLLKIVTSERTRATELTPKQIAQVDSEVIQATQAIGNAWLASNSSALLRVPSIPAPESWNFLLNPLHPQAALLTIEWARPIVYDRRLFHLAHA